MKPRKLTDKIFKYVFLNEIIVILGARQVGKTTLLKILIKRLIENGIHENDIFYFDLEDIFILEMFNKGPEEVFKYVNSKSLNKENKKYIFIDEVQYLKNPSNFLKLSYDHYKEKFKIICTGSSSLEIRKKFQDSMAGRFFSFQLSGLDFDEFLWFKGIKIDLNSTLNEYTNQELIKIFEEYLIFGQYPKIALIENEEIKKHYLLEIIDTYLRKDIREVANFRDILKFNEVMRILSDHSGLLNLNELSNTLRISRKTLEKIIFILENTYIINLVYPFYRNIRSELSKMPKIYFEDTGLKNLLSNQTFLKKIQGEIFENGIYLLLKKKFGKNNIKYWRTKDKKEIDFIVMMENKIFGFEAKKIFTGKIPNTFKYFCKYYPHAKLKIISLFINEKNQNVIYPWEIEQLYN